MHGSGGGVANAKPEHPPDASSGYNYAIIYIYIFYFCDKCYVYSIQKEDNDIANTQPVRLISHNFIKLFFIE